MRVFTSSRLWVFVAIAIGATLWIASGMIGREAPVIAADPERRPTTVVTRISRAEPIERQLVLYGEIVPDQIVRVRAQTAGQIEEMLVATGDRVGTGDVVARLAMDDRMARLRQAEARLTGARGDHQAAQQLAERGHAPPLRVDATQAELEAARSQLEAIELEIANTTMRAPITGIVNRLLAETGDYVPIAGEVVEIVDNDPLRAVVQVPQHAIARVATGNSAHVTIVGHAPIAGRIRFVAPIAEAATRTFRVEIELPNPEGALPSGTSAEVVIPTDTAMAHRISPAVVSLDADGVAGVKTVDDDGVVAFHPIRVERAQADGLWVSGLPDAARVITIGQGFVDIGEVVAPLDEAASEADAVPGPTT